MYRTYYKRVFDIVLSLFGIIVLSPVLITIAIAIVIDNPGPVIFKQKRIGLNKKLFRIWKFRSMKMSTPHDMPTHMLENPEQYITRVGRVLRKTSADELLQIFHILSGKMSIIGPRPALWNQDDLIAERDKYGANDVTPGLTGWAQVNGRDAIDIVEKARLDGEYVKNLTFKMDWTCLWITVGSILKQNDVIEGGTGMIAKQLDTREYEDNDIGKQGTKYK
jgi:lipopolysaccharide/colanic/teichoic acid biosynthesis glycosyltransferase